MNIEKNNRPEETKEELKRWLTSTGLYVDRGNVIIDNPYTNYGT